MKNWLGFIYKKVKKTLKNNNEEEGPSNAAAAATTTGGTASSSNPQSAAAPSSSSPSSNTEIVPDTTVTKDKGKGVASGSGSNTDQLTNETNNEISQFFYKDLKVAAGKFRKNKQLGKGGFGRVYRGYLASTKQDVAIKRLRRTSGQGSQQFDNELKILGRLRHENIIQLIGYSDDKKSRLALVYEYMSLGSLDDHLFDRRRGDYKFPILDWSTRIKIATETAIAVEYLHVTNDPPIVFGDMKCANILLGDGFNVKLSDFGNSRFLPDTYAEKDILGSKGYIDPYMDSGMLTLTSDIYSFGVVLLELIAGRRSIDEDRSARKRDLVEWAKPIFRDSSRFKELVDPLLRNCPINELQKAILIVAMCVEVPINRPTISEVVTALRNIDS